MSDGGLTRLGIDTLLPEGKAWEPVEGGDYDNLLEGMAANSELVRKDIQTLANIRNPRNTPNLSDLEREYGITPDESLTEAERRERLESKIVFRNITGAADELQDRLQTAGFDLQVHSNDPAADPELLLNRNFQMVAGGSNAFAGNPGAFAGRAGGEIIANGLSSDFDFPIIVPSGYWSLYFFVGGDATRDGGGFLTSIDIANIPVEDKNRLIKLIAEYKGLHVWCGLVVGFVA